MILIRIITFLSSLSTLLSILSPSLLLLNNTNSRIMPYQVGLNDIIKEPLDHSNDEALQDILNKYSRYSSKRKKINDNNIDNNSNMNNRIYKYIKKDNNDNKNNNNNNIKSHNDVAKEYFNRKFARKEAPHPATKHELVFVIQQRNLEKLYEILIDVSNIHSKNYTNYKDFEEIGALTSNMESTKTLIDYLNTKGVTIKGQTFFGEYITAEANISSWNDMFQTTFHAYLSVSDFHDKDRVHLRAESFTIPNKLRSHISTVFNIIDIPHRKVKPMIVGAEEMEDNNNRKLQPNPYPVIDISVINNYYGITNNDGGISSSQLVFATINQSFSPADLKKFQQTFNIPLQNVTNIEGLSDNNYDCHDVNRCVEGNLDIQYIMAVARKMNCTFHYTDNFWTDFLVELSSRKYVPSVISISYASYEALMTEEYIRQFDIEAQKLSLRGVSILAASGDDGVAGFDLDSKKACGYKSYFPASSPFVTTVGGTEGPESGNEEVSCQNGIVSGGGFSNIYDLPDWQKTDVNNYIKNNKQFLYGGYNSNGRGYPDISAVARNYKVFINKELFYVSGTSASTPVVAGMVSLVNYRRLQAGMKPLGWLNPSLYALKDSILKNDIKVGRNNCGKVTASGITCCSEGFVASTGWDPITGLGSLDYSKFLQVYSSTSFSNNTVAYTPTSSPVSTPGSPTSYPTYEPTHFSHKKGWLYQTVQDSQCPIKKVGNSEYLGYPLESCMKQFSKYGTIRGSRLFACTVVNGVEYIIKEEHTSSSCTDSVPNLTIYSTGCVSMLDTDYQVYGSLNLYCDDNDLSTLSIFNSAQDNNPPDYSVLLEYDLLKSQDCASDVDVSRFYAFYNNKCFNYEYYLKGALVTISYMYSFPYYYTYSKANCDSNYLVKKYSLLTDCYDVNTDDYENDDDDSGDDSVYLGFRQKWIFTGKKVEEKPKRTVYIVIVVVVLLGSMTILSLIAYFYGEKIASLIRSHRNGAEPVRAVASVSQIQIQPIPEVEVQHQFIQLPNNSDVAIARPISSSYAPGVTIVATPAFNNRRQSTIIVASNISSL